MATGANTQLAKQAGEYLVAAELARRAYTAATFSGNVPHLDILAASGSGQQRAIQVKAIRGASWQFSITDFAEVDIAGGRQFVRRTRQSPFPGLVCVLVVLAPEYGGDEFYVLTWTALRDVLVRRYRDYLDRCGHVRPKKWDSTHAALRLSDLPETSRNNWDLLGQS